jgi:hypothetical protein
MGIWPDVSDKSSFGRFRWLVCCHALDTRYAANSAIVTPMVPDFRRFDLHGRDIACVWFRVSSTPPSQLVTLGAAPTS